MSLNSMNLRCFNAKLVLLIVEPNLPLIIIVFNSINSTALTLSLFMMISRYLQVHSSLIINDTLWID